MNTLIKSKKIVLKFFVSLILSIIITLLNESLPDKKFSEYKVKINLNESVGLLILLLPYDIRYSLDTILLPEYSEIEEKIKTNSNIIDKCSFATINNDYIVSSSLTKHSLTLNFIIEEGFKTQNCNLAVKKQLNEMFRQFFQSLLITQVNIYKEYLDITKENEKYNTQVMDSVLKELEKNNNKNLNVNFLQSYNIDQKNLISQKNMVDTLQNILNLNDPFTIYGKKISVVETNPAYIFIFCLLFIFLILNYSFLYNYLRKNLS